MEIRFNKGLTIILSSLLMLTYLFGVSITLLISEIYDSNSEFDFTIYELIISNLPFLIPNLSRIIIGFWLFFNALKFNQDKWSWFILGLTFGQYSLILLAILLVIQNIKTKVHIYKSLSPILILLIIALLLKPATNFLLVPYLHRTLHAKEYINYALYNSYMSLLTTVTVLVLNIILAIKLHNLIKQLNLGGKIIWPISTLFLGLFPVILFNELILVKIDNQ